MEWSNVSLKSLQARKKPPPPRAGGTTVSQCAGGSAITDLVGMGYISGHKILSVMNGLKDHLEICQHCVLATKHLMTVTLSSSMYTG